MKRIKGFSVKNRVAKGILAAVLAVSLVPITGIAAFADTDEEEVVAEVQDVAQDQEILQVVETPVAEEPAEQSFDEAEDNSAYSTDESAQAEDSDLEAPLALEPDEDHFADANVAEPASAAKESNPLDAIVLKPQELYDEVTKDEVRVVTAKIDEIVDGTGPWDADSNPGNDSGEHNKIVRSYDTVVYAIHYTTQATDPANHWKHGWIYCEATLPCDPESATFDLNAIERDYPEEYDGPRTVVYDEATNTQKLIFFRERVETKNGSGDIIEPLPNEATFPVTISVLGAKNGQVIQPTFKVSVAYFDEENDGALMTEGPEWDKPVTLTADSVRVSAAARYNVKIEHEGGSENFNGAIDNYNFATGNGAGSEYPALYRNKGKVYGRMVSFGITLELFNDNENKGLKGIEIPTGPITFDLELSQTFAGESVSEIPLIWSYGPQINGKSAQQDGRDVNSYVSSSGDYAVYESPRNEHSTAAWRAANPGASSPVGEYGTADCWDGGTWHMQVDGSNERIVHVTVADYEINMNWFPNVDLGNSTAGTVYYNPKNGVTNKGAFSGGQVFVIVPFGGNTDSSNPNYYPTKYNKGGNVTLVVQDRNLRARSVSGQQVTPSTPQPETTDDRFERAVVLVPPGNCVNRIFYQADNRYGVYAERGVNDTYASFLDGSDVAVLGQQISACFGFIVNPLGEPSNSVASANSLLKFDPKVMTPTGEVVANSADTSYYPEPGSVTYKWGTLPGGRDWDSDTEMNDLTEDDFVFYNSLSAAQAAGKVVALKAEARNYAPQAQQERLTFSARFTINMDTEIVDNTFPLTSGSRGWTASQRPGVDTPKYNTYNSSETFQKAWYDDEGYHAESGNYIYGDTIYIVGYKTSIVKRVEQANGPTGGTVNYSLSKGQTVVDYVLKPDFDLPDIGGVSFNGLDTLVTVSDILPAGLTYIEGSAFIEGTWQVDPETGNDHMHGVIEGGESREPDSIIVNDDGTTTLVWRFPHTPIENGTIPQIHFAAELPQEISRTTSYVNTATIGTTEDKRKHEAGNGNLSTATILVAPASDLVCIKQVEHPFVDVNDPIQFMLRWNNTAPAGSFDNVMMDTLPANEDSRGSAYNGTYVIGEDITFEFAPTKTAANYTFYYTEDAIASEMSASDFQEDYVAGNFTGDTVTLQDVTWTKLPITADNSDSAKPKGTVACAGKTMTAFVILGRIDKMERLQAYVTLQPSDDKIGDVFVNMLSSNLSTSTRSARVVDRVISGKVWIDENLDGSSEQAEEPLVAGVRVDLLVMDESGSYVPALDEEGNPRFQITDEDGYYEFDTLAPGTYRVNFTNGGLNLKTYLSTIQNAEGVSDHYNSKATPIYEDEVFAFIEGIELPVAKEIKESPYRVPYQDLGLYENAKKDYDNEDEDNPTWQINTPVKVGDVIPYKITFTCVSINPENIVFTDTFSKGLQFNEDAVLQAQDQEGEELELALELVSTEEGEDGSVTYTWKIDQVPAKASGAVTYSATVADEAVEEQLVQNDATVTLGNLPQMNIGSLKNPVPDKKSGILATGTAANDGAPVKAGTQIPYEIYFANGSDDVATIVVTDTMSKGLAYTAGTATLDGESLAQQEKVTLNSDGSTTVVWTVEVPAGWKGSIKYSATVTEDAEKVVSNNATIDFGNGNVAELTPVENPVPEKRYSAGGVGDGGAKVQVGDNVAYEIAFMHVKDDPTTITITDTMTQGLEYAAGTAALSDGTKPTKESVSKQANGSTAIVWTFENVAKGDYTLIYKGKVTSSSVTTVKNNASIAYGEGAAVALEELENPIEPPAAAGKVPRTGDNIPFTLFMTLGLAGIALVYFSRRDRVSMH